MSDEERSAEEIAKIIHDEISTRQIKNILEPYTEATTINETELAEHDRLASINNKFPVIISLSFIASFTIIQVLPMTTLWLGIVLLGVIVGILSSIGLVITQKELDFDSYTPQEKFIHFISQSLQNYWEEDYEGVHENLLASRSHNVNSSVYHPQSHKILLHYTNRVTNTQNPEQEIENTFADVVPIVIFWEVITFNQSRNYYNYFPGIHSAEENQPRSRHQVFFDAAKKHIVAASRKYVSICLLIISLLVIGGSYIFYDGTAASLVATCILIVFAVSSPTDWLANWLEKTESETDE